MSKAKIDQPSYVSKLPTKDAEYIKGVPVDDSAIADDYMLVYDAATETLGYESGPAPGAHTIASHSDTTATGAELETLTDGSNADALHAHAAGGGDTHPMVETTKLVKDAGGTKWALIDVGTNGPGGNIIVYWPSADLNLESVKDHLADTSDPHGADMTVSSSVDVPTVSGLTTLKANVRDVSIADSAGEVLAHFDADAASPVCYLTFKASLAGGSSVLIGTAGSQDKDIRITPNADKHIRLQTSGTGRVKANQDGTDREVVTISGTQTLTDKTLTTPTIGDLTNATHTHQNAAGGGSTLTSPQINTPTLNDAIIEDTIGFDTIETIASFTGAKTCNWNDGQVQQATMAGAVTLSFTDPPKAGWYYLWITQATGTHYDITWSDVGTWVRSETPVVTTADGALDLFAIWYTGTAGVYRGVPLKNFG